MRRLMRYTIKTSEVYRGSDMPEISTGHSQPSRMPIPGRLSLPANRRESAAVRTGT